MQIAFDAADIKGAHIYVIPADGGAPRRLTSGSGENVVPSWSRDGKFVFFASNRSGNFQIWKCRAETGETRSSPAAQVTRGGGFRAFESADGSYLYFAKGRGKPGLWRRGLLGNPEAKNEF
jgi:Tol biopolymer transport system component